MVPVARRNLLSTPQAAAGRAHYLPPPGHIGHFYIDEWRALAGEHCGETYYFCSRGCRAEFLEKTAGATAAGA
jgi:YHS domain-containing protein